MLFLFNIYVKKISEQPLAKTIITQGTDGVCAISKLYFMHKGIMVDWNTNLKLEVFSVFIHCLYTNLYIKHE